MLRFIVIYLLVSFFFNVISFSDGNDEYIGPYSKKEFFKKVY